jgi:hypothetical protein
MRNVSRTLIAVATFVAAVALSTVAEDAAPAGALATSDKRVMLVTDSVGLGTRGVFANAFPSDWDAVVVGEPARFVEQLEANFVRPNLFRAGDHVVIAGGYNYPFWDPERFERSIDSIINTLTGAGVKHVYWVTLREVKQQFVTPAAWRQVQPYYWYFPTVNEHLERALDRHPQLTLVDWAAAANRSDVTYDAIHLNRTGAELYSSLVARAVNDAQMRPGNGGVTRVNVATPAQVASGGVVAAAVNVTSVRGRVGGYLSAFPCEQGSSSSSNLNHIRDQVIAAAAIVPIGPSGDICVFNERAGHLVVDAFGTFGADADITTSEPARVLDTRTGGRQRANDERSVIAVPDATTAEVVALNITVTRADGSGFLTVHECGSEPTNTSNVNFGAFLPSPNLVIAASDADGRVCFTTSQNAHVLVDVLATFGEDTTLAAATPHRLLDTRSAVGRVADEVVEIEIPAPADGSGVEAGGVVGNLTIVGASSNGFATVYPCANGRPDTSNINYRGGQTIANAVLVEPDVDGKVCVYSSGEAHIVFDLLATTGTGFASRPPARLTDTRIP